MESRITPKITRYTPEDDRNIVLFLIEENGWELVRGDRIWKKAEQLNVCPERTCISLKYRFLEAIMPHIWTKYGDMLKRQRVVLPMFFHQIRRRERRPRKTVKKSTFVKKWIQHLPASGSGVADLETAEARPIPYPPSEEDDEKSISSNETSSLEQLREEVKQLRHSNTNLKHACRHLLLLAESDQKRRRDLANFISCWDPTLHAFFKTNELFDPDEYQRENQRKFQG